MDTTTTLTYFFADLESSTRLWEQHPVAMQAALARHDAILQGAVEGCAGTVVKTTGDGLNAVFSSPSDAVAAAVRSQRELQDEPWGETGPLRVRIGIHIGEAQPRAGDYYGPAVNRAARIMAAAHGGQILVSGAVAETLGPSPGPDLALRDLGTHRLKDLAGPEHLYQVGQEGLLDAFPPPATVDLRPNNLPTQTSVFMGREAELKELRSLLDADQIRLVTLTGPGGTGKTRLGLQAAADQIGRFEDGLYFVDLAAERDAAAVFSTMVRTIGIELGGEDDPLEALKQGLSRRHMMLLLDNFEQVTDAAIGLAELLEACPGVTVLVTSREALRLRGEYLFAVRPLTLPTPDNGAFRSVETVMESEAVRLFVERAVAAMPSFEVSEGNLDDIASICVRLDGLPLAIELAAARLRVFAPGDLRERLESRLDVLRGGARDLPGRQQTLRDTIAWSYELLTREEQCLFEMFSVFSGATFNAVEELAGRFDGLYKGNVIDDLESLVHKSLIRTVDDGGSRLSMLGTIRDYAAERLTGNPQLEQGVRRSHAAYYTEMATEARAALSGSGRREVLDELTLELDNLRSAWRFWVGEADLQQLNELLDTLWILYDANGWYHGAVELANDLLGVLALEPETPDRIREEVSVQTSLARALMAIRGYTAEVEEAFARALDLSSASDPPRRFPMLRSLASLYVLRGESAKGVEVGRELLALADEQGDPALQVDAHLVLGASVFPDDLEAGLGHFDAAIDRFAPEQRAGRFRVGPSSGVVSLTTSAFLLWMLGFPERAVSRADRAVRLADELAHPYSKAYALYHVAFLDVWRQEFESVSERTTQLLQLANTHDYLIWRGLAMILRGVSAVAQGEPDTGLAEIDRGIELYHEAKTPPVFWSLILGVRAAAFGMAGRLDDGLAVIAMALELADRAGGLAAEFFVIEGDLLRAIPDRAGDAEDSYERALALARDPGVRMTELRAATRLAELRRGTPGGAPALALLGEIYSTFTEGFDTPDLVAAGAVLDGG